MTQKDSKNDELEHLLDDQKRTWWIILVGVFIISASIIAYDQQANQLEQITEKGELRIITRNSATTYYEHLDGKAGFEYDLAKAFAESLNVELTVIVPEKNEDIIPMLNGGQADIAAAGIILTDEIKGYVQTGPAYQTLTQEIIYKSQRGKSKPASIEDLLNKNLIVSSNSAQQSLLTDLQIEYPELSWTIQENANNEQLLDFIQDGEYDITIMNSNEFQHYRRLFPNLRTAFSIGSERQLQWAFANNNDSSLIDAANTFFEQYQNSGQLTQLKERYYGHIDKYSPVEMAVFLRNVNQRLDLFKSTFVEAGEIYNIDWRLLAAIAYQESHWESDAVSPTGVRGIMMLTLRTAAELNVSNRLDSRESILGGAEYFTKMLNRMPADIPEPDRTWMALASYNVGFGHLEDARVLTEKLGGDPDRWIDVKERLPLLSQKKWYQQTKFGYARGREPVVYVQNIREYYETLQWVDERSNKSEEINTADNENPPIEVTIPKIL